MCDITLSREQTVNTGNYSNVKPNVSITLKDVDTGSFEDKYGKLSNLVSCLLSYETKTALEEINMVSPVNDNCKQYAEKLEKNVNFHETIKNLTQELKE